MTTLLPFVTLKHTFRTRLCERCPFVTQTSINPCDCKLRSVGWTVTSPAVACRRQWSHLTRGSMRHTKDARLGADCARNPNCATRGGRCRAQAKRFDRQINMDGASVEQIERARLFFSQMSQRRMNRWMNVRPFPGAGVHGYWGQKKTLSLQ